MPTPEEAVAARAAKLASTNIIDWKVEQKDDPVLYQVVKHLRTPRETFKEALLTVLDKKATTAYVKAKEQLLLKNGLLYRKTHIGPARSPRDYVPSGSVDSSPETSSTSRSGGLGVAPDTTCVQGLVRNSPFNHTIEANFQKSPKYQTNIKIDMHKCIKLINILASYYCCKKWGRCC